MFTRWQVARSIDRRSFIFRAETADRVKLLHGKSDRVHQFVASCTAWIGPVLLETLTQGPSQFPAGIIQLRDIRRAGPAAERASRFSRTNLPAFDRRCARGVGRDQPGCWLGSALRHVESLASETRRNCEPLNSSIP